MRSKEQHPFVSRGGIKLQHALDTFSIEVRGKTCADLGCSTGGFTDCLLHNGARHVYAVDTAKNILEWKLRTDPRVTLMESTNALHATLPEPVDIVTIDVSWTKQKLIIPHAYTLLRETGDIITLVKPHYEAPKNMLTKGTLEEQFIPQVLEDVREEIQKNDVIVREYTESPIRGAKGGNVEYLFWIHKQL